MKKARMLVLLMYLHLMVSMVAPFMAVIIANKYNSKSGLLCILLYVIIVLAIQMYGWICAVSARKLLKHNNIEELRKAWLLLKLKTVPFYIVNYIYSFLMWFVLVAASRGIFIIFVWIPVAITCYFIIQSGIYGYCYIKYMRDIKGIGITNNQVIMQFIPVLDFFGTLKLRRIVNDVLNEVKEN
ncbi:MAG: hypothetical protein PUE71_10220 [Clostridia bacterium]|nr:hypothetical protein [Clostridia bacterium]